MAQIPVLSVVLRREQDVTAQIEQLKKSLFPASCASFPYDQRSWDRCCRGGIWLVLIDFKLSVLQYPPPTFPISNHLNLQKKLQSVRLSRGQHYSSGNRCTILYSQLSSIQSNARPPFLPALYQTTVAAPATALHLFSFSSSGRRLLPMLAVLQFYPRFIPAPEKNCELFTILQLHRTAFCGNNSKHFW